MAFEYKFIDRLDEELKVDLDQKYGIDELDIEDVYTNTQLSKVEQRKDYLYVALQFPEYNRDKRHFLTKEVHCFVSDKFFLVLDKHEFKHVRQFHDLRERIIDAEEQPFYAFYEMLDFIVTKIFRVLNKFRQEIGRVETELFDENGRIDLVNEIQIIKRNLVNFYSIIFPLEALVTELQIRYVKFVDEEGVELLDDSLDKIKKMINNLNNFKQQMAMITETNEALIARNTNETIKVLTAVNLIAVLPTALTSFFGMNLYFGWDPNERNFVPLIIVSSLVLISSSLVLIYFKKRKLL